MSTLKLSGLENIQVAPLSLVFLIKDGKVLTLHRAKDKKIYPDRIHGIGGKVEPGEDLFASAKREFKEETGLELKNITLRGTFGRILSEKYINLLYIFIATDFSGELIRTSVEGEVSWLSLEDFLSHPRIVDHVKLYLPEILKNKNFYTGMGYYQGEELESYADCIEYYKSRAK